MSSIIMRVQLSKFYFSFSNKNSISFYLNSLAYSSFCVLSVLFFYEDAVPPPPIDVLDLILYWEACILFSDYATLLLSDKTAEL